MFSECYASDTLLQVHIDHHIHGIFVSSAGQTPHQLQHLTQHHLAVCSQGDMRWPIRVDGQDNSASHHVYKWREPSVLIH